MRYFLIMNPGSKGGKSEKRFNLIHKLFEGYDYSYAVTKTLDDAYFLSKKANADGFNAIIAVGGDGTINRVLNGFYNNQGKRTSAANFGVIYTGTSPDFCKTYNIPINTEKAVKTILNGKMREIDIGKIEFTDGVRYFACCANIGLGASLANNANSGIRKTFGDTMGTFFALIKTLTQYKPIDFSVNGKELKHVYNLSVGKTYYVASGLKITHELAQNDERFYLLPLHGQVVGNIYKLYTGKPIKNIEYASEIEIKGEGKVEFDGDEGGELPCIISNAERLGVYVE